MSTYTAIILEPRVHYALGIVLSNFLKNLDDNWNIIIFHSKHNAKYIRHLINSSFYKEMSRITSIQLNINNLNLHTYSQIFCDQALYNYIPTEIFLVFQIDTLCSDIHKNLIYDFIEYDYIGAPWKHLDDVVGNGGLSLRRKSKMLETIKNKIVPNEYFHEDIYFCIDNKYVNKAPFNKALNFSIESIFSEKSFGIHKCWAYMNEDELKIISNHIPDIYKLISLQSNSIKITDDSFDINTVFDNVVVVHYGKKDYYNDVKVIVILILLLIIFLFFIGLF